MTRLIKILMLLLLPVPGFAAQERLIVEADRVDLDRKQNLARYIGHVKAQKGDMEIEAAMLDMYVDGRNIRVLEAEGDPVVFRRGVTKEKGSHVTAKKMNYDLSSGKMKFEGGVIAQHNGGNLEGGVVLYDVKQDVMKVEGGGGPSRDRVRIELPVEQMKAE